MGRTKKQSKTKVTTNKKVTPKETTPVETTPVENTLVENTPVENTPVENTLVETTPVETTPVETTPVENVLTDEELSEGENLPGTVEDSVSPSELNDDSFTITMKSTKGLSKQWPSGERMTTVVDGVECYIEEVLSETEIRVIKK